MQHPKDKKVTARGWCGDEDFLAEKLKKIFVIIETDDERSLHNDMVDDVMMMVGNAEDPKNRALRYNYFLKGVARIISNKPKDFLRRVARFITNVSRRIQ